MRILILGTSNSILRNGWVAGLKKALPNAEVENKSVGASPGIQFATRLRTNFALYDAVFLDSVPNDEEFDEFVGEKSYIDKIMLEIASTISAKTCLVMIGFTKVNYLYQSSDPFERRKLLANAVGACFLDVAALTREFGEAVLGKGAALYEDHPAHVASPFAHRIGEALGEALPEILINNRRYQNAMIDFSGNYEVWRSVDHFYEKIYHVKNSLIDEAFLNISVSEEIPIHMSGICLGAYVNWNTTSAVIEMHHGQSIRRLQAFTDWPSNGTTLMFVPFKGGQDLDALSISEARDDVAERWIFSQIPDGRPTCLCLASLLFRQNNIANSLPEIPLSSFDLTDFIRFILRKQYDSTSTILTLPSKLDTISTYAMLSHHQTMVVLDTKKNIVLAISKDKIEPYHLLISIKENNEFFDLEAVLGLIRVEIVIENEKLKAKTPGCCKEKPAKFSIIQSEEKFFLYRDGKYLTAEADGTVAHDRQSPHDWEKFVLMLI